MEQENRTAIENIKVALIFGEKKVDGVSRDGELEEIYKEDDDTAHFFYMREYLQDNMKDEKELQATIEKHDVNSLFFEIQKLGHIVFAENTSTLQYKTGLFYIPKSISDKQKQTLKKIMLDLQTKDYNITELTNLHRTAEGILTGNQRQGKANILQHLTNIELDER